jgi:hypothetical protein
MSFFYDLNKRLNSIRELPETTHQQLNEGAHTQDAMKLNPDFKKVGQKPGIMGKIAKGAKRVADFVAPGDEDLLRDLERKSGGKRPVKENSSRDIDRILANFPREVKAFKQGGELDRDLEEALWDYHYNLGTIRNYNSDASAYIAQDLADHLGIAEAANDTEGPSDLLAAVEEEMNNPGGSVDNLRDVMNATFGSDRSPEFKKARAVIGKYLDLVDNAEVGSEQDGIAPMRGGNIARHIREYDLTDRLAHAAAMLDKVVGMKEGNKFIGNLMKARAAGKKQADLDGDGKMEPVKEAVKEIPGGRRHTAEPGGYGRKSDDDAPKPVVKKGRGRPKKGSDSETGEVMKPDWSAFGVGGKVKLPKHTGAVTKHKMVGESNADVATAYTELMNATTAYVRALGKFRKVHEPDTVGIDEIAEYLDNVMYELGEELGLAESAGSKKVNEKAVSKKQQKFMGMVHAAQKGEKPASKEVAKVAKEMPKKEATKFAKTKHKGLPEKKKKTDETTVAGNVATAESSDEPKSSKGGIKFGGSIYDSVNRKVENLIAESMNVNMSMNSDEHGGPSKSLTVTATDEDADKLAAMLQMAGLGGQSPEAAYADSACQVDENQPENTPDPVSGDGEMYAGGLNKPKRDVAGDGQATGTVTAVHTTDDDDEELRRIREMAGIRESKKPDFLDVDKDGDKSEPMSKAAKEKDDKKEEKVDESIFASTANLWKTYKG